MIKLTRAQSPTAGRFCPVAVLAFLLTIPGVALADGDPLRETGKLGFLEALSDHGTCVDEPLTELVAAGILDERQSERSARSVACADAPTTLCLHDDRFQVELDWRASGDVTMPASVVPFDSDGSGMFYFFDSDTIEVHVNVIDGCSVNGHAWIFAAASTHVEWTMRVTDTLTGEVRTYSNPLGEMAPAITDTSAFSTCPTGFCPPIFHRGTLSLDFNPAFLHIDAFDDGAGGKADALTITSFFNVARVPGGGPPPVVYLERDLVARIPDLDSVDPATFDAAVDVEVLTDLGFPGPGLGQTVWPNEAVRAPDGMFPFEAVVVPQGFLSAPAPGRLTAVDLSNPGFQEYVIHQSTQNFATGFTFPGDPGNSPRAYHRAIFLDMNGDGLLDVVSVRSGFRVVPSFYPPFSELVWFENPGAALDPQVPWNETVLYGGPAAGFLGPDIALEAHDFEGDGVPEIVTTHFFSGPGAPLHGTITLYGAPAGGHWSDVDASSFQLPRVRDLAVDQGLPFDVRIVDLNLDGRADVLATNHQPDGCSPFTSSPVPGRVFALESPADGDVFGQDWTLHVLLDDIRPQPTPAPVAPPGRLGPGGALPFYPRRGLEGETKPWIVVGGDEAAKVWVLAPKHPDRPDDWTYRAAVVFDINDFYGPGTTQMSLEDPFGITVSTIGAVAVRYDDPGPEGHAELWVPVFEGRDVQVLSFRPDPLSQRVECPADELLACPAGPQGGRGYLH